MYSFIGIFIVLRDIPNLVLKWTKFELNLFRNETYTYEIRGTGQKSAKFSGKVAWLTENTALYVQQSFDVIIYHIFMSLMQLIC